MPVRRRACGPLLAVCHFFGHALLMKIVLSVVMLLNFFMLLKGSEFLCMLLLRIVVLVLINLVCLPFSYVLMGPVKFKLLVVVFALSAVGIKEHVFATWPCALTHFAARHLRTCFFFFFLVVTGLFPRLLLALLVFVTWCTPHWTPGDTWDYSSVKNSCFIYFFRRKVTPFLISYSFQLFYLHC